ncbi:MAG TPA: ATP phosphoribosyltransferase regulatory subunit [Candidatus Baltobacteraceae bacterium]|nr:ATP phosphoribosyltransferase regulatory subunit [Candidatus Baltobacteraceae bacterium]
MRLPAGTRDWLPPELQRKRAVENVLRGVFERWAYAEVQTPAFERFDALELGLGDGVAEKTFLFNDRAGTQLALRPEMTTPVARLISTRMREAPLPLRLSYVQSAFRYEEPQEGRMREFTQAGLELVGPSSVDADAESIFTALEALDALGLGDAQFDINHAAIIDGVLANLEWDPAQLAACKRLIAGRNIVALRKLLAERKSGTFAAELVELVMTRGRDELLARAARACKTAEGQAGIERLRELLARAGRLGFEARLAVDLSLLRDISYYTGFIFEGFASEVGFALCGGGRYDTLLPRFGFEAGAVGWSVNVERLLIALERRHSSRFGSAPAVDVLVSGSDVVAARERAAGKVVRIDFEQRSEAELLADARAERIPRVVIASNGEVREFEVDW